MDIVFLIDKKTEIILPCEKIKYLLNEEVEIIYNYNGSNQPLLDVSVPTIKSKTISKIIIINDEIDIITNYYIDDWYFISNNKIYMKLKLNKIIDF
jgi:hypothetical protein